MLAIREKEQQAKSVESRGCALCSVELSAPKHASEKTLKQCARLDASLGSGWKGCSNTVVGSAAGAGTLDGTRRSRQVRWCHEATSQYDPSSSLAPESPLLPFASDEDCIEPRSSSALFLLRAIVELGSRKAGGRRRVVEVGAA